MIKLYGAISQNEKDDYDRNHIFKIGRNTLEVKQFFKSKTAAIQFVERSVFQSYTPPYLYLLIVSIDEECLKKSNPTFMVLDGFNAVNIADVDLLAFNNCIIFVKQELL